MLKLTELGMFDIGTRTVIASLMFFMCSGLWISGPRISPNSCKVMSTKL
jgi:hypothetical protein